MNHPSDLALEKHLLDPASSPAAAHVAGCERCSARLARMEAEGRDFRQFVMPATLPQLEARRQRSWWPKLTPIFAAAAAAAAMFAIARRGPPADYEGTKGATLKLTAYLGGAVAARALDDGAAVPADASLRFAVQTSAPCTLWLVSIDASHEISRLAGPLRVEGARTLPGGVVLDGKPGAERMFAVCTQASLGYDELAHILRGPAAADPRATRSIPGLPRGSTQATLLLEKKRQ